MKLWLDAQLPPLLASWINAQGWGLQGFAVRDVGLRDASDPDILRAAREAGVVVMTKDRSVLACVVSIIGISFGLQRPKLALIAHVPHWTAGGSDAPLTQECEGEDPSRGLVIDLASSTADSIRNNGVGGYKNHSKASDKCTSIISMKASRTFAALFTAAVAITSANAAHAVSVVVNGNTYDVTTFTGSYEANTSTFTTTQMAWWGDATLAQQFATAVGTQLGLPNFGTIGPLFGYSAAPDGIGGYQVSMSNYDSTISPPINDSKSSGVNTYAISSSQPSSAVPGPLPVLGVAASFGMSRRLRRRIKLSA